MHRAKTQSDNSKALSAERKASKAIYRRFTQMDTERNPFKNITAEAQRAQRNNFLFVGRRRQTKNIPQIRAKSFCPIVVSRLGKMGFPQRTLRLCGEMSESLSAIIGVNLRLISERFAFFHELSYLLKRG